MDNVTHTLVGVAVAHAFFRGSPESPDGRPPVPRAVPILALASNLPDIDVLVHLTGSPEAILMRRSFGHSILLLPIWILLFALAAHRLEPRLPLRRHLGLAAIGAGLHVVFDLINSFGVLLLWPAGGWRPELAMVFIIDLVLTGLLALPLLVCIPRRLRWRLPALARVSIVCVILYLGFCGTGRAIATGLIRRAAPAADFVYVFPEPFGPHRWRGGSRAGDVWTIHAITPWSGRIEARYEARTAPDDPTVQAARASDLGRRLENFFKAPVWKARAASAPVACVHDLRFRPLAEGRRAVFAYCFEHENGRYRLAPDWEGRTAD
jgi:membrane-bound metal-dependent hydrolase YbcI (DUF457 family)